MKYQIYKDTVTQHITNQELQAPNFNFWDWSKPVEFTGNRPRIIQETRNRFTVKEIEDDRIKDLRMHYSIDLIDGMLKEALAEQIPTHVEYSYHEFKIPKKSGGMRTITAPTPELKHAQEIIANVLTKKLALLPHNAVHSYTAERGIKTAVQCHQTFESKWFLKLDIKGFFPGITKHVLLQELNKFANFSWFIQHTKLNFVQIKRVYDLMMYKNGLPQGSPASPILSNLVLIDLDIALTQFLGSEFCYTRYADDILISSPCKFQFDPIVKFINQYLKDHYNLELHMDKCRFGSAAGRNWNLGLMLNKDNNITIGYQKKQIIKSRIYNFLKAYQEGATMLPKSAKKLFGEISHFMNIEPDYCRYILTKYEKQFNITFKELYKIFG